MNGPYVDKLATETECVKLSKIITEIENLDSGIRQIKEKVLHIGKRIEPIMLAGSPAVQETTSENPTENHQNVQPPMALTLRQLNLTVNSILGYLSEYEVRIDL